MYIILAFRAAADYQCNTIIDTEDTLNNLIVYVSDKTDKKEALNEFNNKLIDIYVYEDQTIDDNLENFLQFHEIHIFDINSPFFYDFENWMEDLNKLTKQRIDKYNEESEKELYLRLKKKYEKI